LPYSFLEQKLDKIVSNVLFILKKSFIKKYYLEWAIVEGFVELGYLGFVFSFKNKKKGYHF
jgi:hypothetical protein